MQNVDDICRYWAQHKVDADTVKEEGYDTENKARLIECKVQNEYQRISHVKHLPLHSPM